MHNRGMNLPLTQSLNVQAGSGNDESLVVTRPTAKDTASMCIYDWGALVSTGKNARGTPCQLVDSCFDPQEHK